MIRRSRRHCDACGETFEHRTRVVEHSRIGNCSACYLHPDDEWRPVGTADGDLLDLLAGEAD